MVSLFGLVLCACMLDEMPALGGPMGSQDEDDRLLVLPPLQPCSGDITPPQVVRIATWNISAARLSSLSQVEELLASIDADAIVLQEVDVGVARTSSVDQPRVLAEALELDYAFAASLEFDGGDFGLAVLSRLPFSAVRRRSLDSEGGYEPRIVLDVNLCVGSHVVRLIDVHADFVPEANVRNLGDLATILGPKAELPTVVAGDFNASEQTQGVGELLETTDLVDVLATWDPGPTRERERIDYMLVDDARVGNITEARRVKTDVSDHAALWLEITLP